MEESNNTNTNRVTYYETRTVNIGDYESVQFGLSISYSVTQPEIGDKTVRLSDSASKELNDKTLKEINKTAQHLQKIVQTRLDANEKIVRQQIAGWNGVSYDAEKKLMKRNIITKEEYVGKHDKRMEIDDEDLT